jgi:hypothetical protein
MPNVAGNHVATTAANMSDAPRCLERVQDQRKSIAGCGTIIAEIGGKLTSNLRGGSANLSERASKIRG